jgi:hypothetical protein
MQVGSLSQMPHGGIFLKFVYAIMHICESKAHFVAATFVEPIFKTLLQI